MDGSKLSEVIWEQSTEWIDKIGEVIGGMAKQLGVASEHVYEIYTKQVFFEGVFGVGMSALFTLVGIIAIVLMLRWTVKDYKEYEDFGDGHLACVLVSGVITILLVIMFIIYTQPSFLKLMNPEYFTIKEIVDMIGKVVK